MTGGRKSNTLRPDPYPKGVRTLGVSFTLLAAALLLGGCDPGFADPRDQWLVVLGTDLPVPQLGDRLLVEIGAADAPLEDAGAQRRLFSVGDARGWPHSFGVLPPDGGEALRIRARLFRAADTGPFGLPDSDRVVDALAILDPSAGFGRVVLDLHAGCFGVLPPEDGTKSCSTDAGALDQVPVLAPMDRAALVPGSWSAARPVDCPAPAPEGMTCVPGGVFLLGSPLELPVDPGAQPRPERLVRLPPFYLDTEEVTVGAVRPLVGQAGVTAPLVRSADPDAPERFCQYLGQGDPSADGMPVNCVMQTQATAICAALGKRLPTEAEWEWAAGNLAGETLYPWGSDDRVCDHAVVARSPTFHPLGAATCLSVDGKTVDPGPVAAAQSGDATALGLLNMAGNVAEWTADGFEAYGQGCWAANGLVDNPAPCGAGPLVTVRGGHWFAVPFRAKVFQRWPVDPSYALPSVGLRCARSTQ